MSKPLNLIIYSLTGAMIVSGCPERITPGPTPTPTPTQSVAVTPVPVVSFAPILGDYYKIEFGPGSKGVSTFGPGSKGVSEFGPGSKGVSNLRFNVNIPPALVRSELSFNTASAPKISGFNTKANDGTLQLGNLIIMLKQGDKILVKTTLLPVDDQIIFTLFSHDLLPGDYNLLVMAENNFEPLQVADFVKIDSNLEVKIVLYAKELKREFLDIAIRTKPIQELTE